MRPAKLLSVLNREFTSTETGHHTPVMLCGINPPFFCCGGSHSVLL